MRELRLILACLLVVAAGCAGAALEPGDHESTLNHKALRRSYIVHVPPSAVPARPQAWRKAFP